MAKSDEAKALENLAKEMSGIRKILKANVRNIARIRQIEEARAYTDGLRIPRAPIEFDEGE